MKKIFKFMKREIEFPIDIDLAKKKVSDSGFSTIIYLKSLRVYRNTLFFIMRGEKEKKLVIYGNDEFIEAFEGESSEYNDCKLKFCSLSNSNCKVIQSIFPFTRPQSYEGKKFTIGLGDRLGNASVAHLRSLSKVDAFPVIAQQSMRELNLTGRTYRDVLCDASWAVFQEGYTRGFGADGDHLKTAEEIKMALDEGFTMITLDCSEHINNDVEQLNAEELKTEYINNISKMRISLENEYLNKKHLVGKDTEIKILPDMFEKIVVQYQKAIDHTINMYDTLIKNNKKQIDFEISIDETLSSTSPEAHFYIASELVNKGVKIANIAPRFCGEFQKGIDYIGDIAEFEKEFAIHDEIAKHFGYRISVHSGSDKLSIYNIIWKKTNGELHLKTAGTNWLEAVRLVADKAPDLYRKMHKCAIDNIEEAKKYYHVKADVNKIPDIKKMKDKELVKFLDMDDSRQTLHITYGLLLNAKDDKGEYLFRDAFMSTLYKYENEYYMYLQRHIARHIEKLSGQKMNI